jgi:endonuclease/exonuclease/phosphatase family metal-dependent hydrolase
MNLRHDSDFWEERFPLIADEVVRLAPDLIGLQEVEIARDQDEILARLVLERDASLAFERRREAKSGLAVLSGEGIGTFSRLPIVEHQVLDLMWGRVVTLDRVALPEGPTTAFYNTHLHNEGGDEVRGEQAAALVRFIEATSAGDLVLLTGDMNATDDSRAIAAFLAAGLVDTFRAAHGERTPELGATSPIVLAKEPVAQSPRRRIDYVFARGSTAATVEVRSSTVAFDRPRADGLYPSDHLGVMTEIAASFSVLSSE